MKLFRKYKALCAAVAVLVLCACCSRELNPSGNDIQTEVPIEFASTNMQTKGLDELNYERIIENRFGLFAYLDDGNAYLENRNVEYISSTGTTNYWRCSPAAYWPFQSSLSFYAYAPYQEKVCKEATDTENPAVIFPSEDYVSGMPRLRFTPPADVTHQPDFCVAVPNLNVTHADGSVHLSFHHTLSRIRFYANLKGQKSPSYDYKITSLTIKGVETSNILTYVDDEQRPYEWDKTDLSSPKTGSYNLSTTKSQLTPTSLPFENELPDNVEGLDRYVHINSMFNGRLYLLPQRLTSSAKLEVVVSLYKQGTEDLVSILPPFTISLPTDVQWIEEKTISYIMTIDIENSKESKMSISIKDWEDADNTHNTETLE